jgi:hypothetical protein
MTHPPLPWKGACRCGQVTFEVTAPPMLTMACHCTGCQRMTGSAFSASTAFRAEHFAVTDGEPVVGGLHGDPVHYFCPHCMSWMFTRPAQIPWMVNVRTTMLDAPAHLPPFAETYVSEKLPWAETGAEHRYERFPAFEEFAGLGAAFSQRWTAETGSPASRMGP